MNKIEAMKAARWHAAIALETALDGGLSGELWPEAPNLTEDDIERFDAALTKIADRLRKYGQPIWDFEPKDEQ